PKPARPLRQAPRGAADAGSRLRRKECAGAPTTTTHGVGMTREAKIGLLVALAFLLVIGILLSDHVSTATREPPAPLSGIEQNIRGSTSAPGAGVTPNINTPPVLPEQTVAAETSPYVLDPRTGAGGMQVGV